MMFWRSHVWRANRHLLDDAQPMPRSRQADQVGQVGLVHAAQDEGVTGSAGAGGGLDALQVVVPRRRGG